MMRQQQLAKDLNLEISPQNKSCDHFFKKSFIKLDQSWSPYSLDKFKNITLDALLSGRERIIMQFDFEGDAWFVATHNQDAKSLRNKYPDEKIISIESILGMFTPETIDMEIEADNIKEIFNLISFFPARFVDMRSHSGIQ